MKKTLIALAAVAATSVFAQSTVTLSGTAGAEYGRSNVADSKGQLNNPDDGQNTLAFAGTETLGGGMKAMFYSQMRFSNVSGSAIGNSPMQNTYIALAGGFGSVQAGRFLTGTLSGFDAFGGYGAEPRAEYGYESAVGARNNNTLQYTSPSMGGFSAQFATTLTGATGSTADVATLLGSERREYQYLGLNFTAGKFKARFVSERNNTAAAGSDTGLGLSYDLGAATVFMANSKAAANANVVVGGVAVGRAAVSNTSIGVRVPMGAATLKASYRSGDSATVTAVGVDYALSKRTGLYADVGSSDAATTVMAYRFGVTHSF